MLSDARELAGDQQLDADVHMVGLSRVRPVIGYSGWPFESTQLDPCAHARVVGGLGLFDYDPRRWPDPALKNRRLLPLSRRAHSHGCCRPTLPVVALAPRPADDLKKWLAD